VDILGLDISSSTIGWSVLRYSGGEIKLVSCGHIKPPPSSKGSLVYRLNSAYKQIEELLSSLGNIDDIAIEAYANKFTKGRSSARTIIVLSVFNELISLACLRSLSIEPKKYAVVSVRSSLSKFFNKNISSKDDAFLAVENYFENFKTALNRNGALKKECYDEADAIAVAITYIYREIINV
tara:strand:+ start:63435 stop:63977 length:543 start_codon:yes stop_codon:yes gene_type:complete